MDAARTVALPGDVVLLSPACTSYDAYEGFERRGEHFRMLVQEIAKLVLNTAEGPFLSPAEGEQLPSLR